MQTKLNSILDNSGINRKELCIAFGCAMDPLEAIQQATSFEELVGIVNETEPRYMHGILRRTATAKALSMINSSEMLHAFLNAKHNFGLIKEQQGELKELFAKYGTHLINDVKTLNELSTYQSDFYQTEVQKVLVRKKYILLRAEMIVKYETLAECKLTYTDKEIDKLVTLRGYSIVRRDLESVTTSQEVKALLDSGYIPAEFKGPALQKNYDFLVQELRVKNISRDECMRIYYVTSSNHKYLAYKAIVKAFHRSERSQSAYQDFYKLAQGTHPALTERIKKEWGELTLELIQSAKTVDGCFTYGHGGYCIRTPEVQNLVLIRVFELATTVKDYLDILNLIKNYKNTDKFNTRERCDAALDAAMISIETFEEWQHVWWASQYLYMFKYKCLRRLKAWVDSQDRLNELSKQEELTSA
jgi:hypothetical protein